MKFKPTVLTISISANFHKKVQQYTTYELIEDYELLRKITKIEKHEYGKRSWHYREIHVLDREVGKYLPDIPRDEISEEQYINIKTEWENLSVKSTTKSSNGTISHQIRYLE